MDHRDEFLDHDNKIRYYGYICVFLLFSCDCKILTRIHGKEVYTDGYLSYGDWQIGGFVAFDFVKVKFWEAFLLFGG